MGPLTPLAVVGGVLGFGLWWLLGLLPLWNLSSYLWYFVGTGAFGLVILSLLTDEGGKVLWSFLGWGVLMLGIFALSWVSAWALDAGLFGDNPDENIGVYYNVGVIALVYVGFYVWEIANWLRKRRKLQRTIAEGRERTRQRRERRRKGIPAGEPRGESESGEHP